MLLSDANQNVNMRMKEIRIPEKRGASFQVNTGEEFEVTDPMGNQVADLVAFGANDTENRFSSKYTYKKTNKIRISTGDSLYTTGGEPILTIESDDCGTHDLLYAPCNNWVLSDYGQESDTHGCRENLFEALEPTGISKHQVHSTMNIFMKSTITEQTYIDIREPESQPGDTVRFKADQDAIIAVSSCAGEAAVNAGETKPIDIKIPESAMISSNF